MFYVVNKQIRKSVKNLVYMSQLIGIINRMNFDNFNNPTVSTMPP
jgi:hypothetical protein